MYDQFYDVCLTDSQYPNEAYMIQSLDYYESENVSYRWLNSKEGRDYFWLNHGERPDFIKSYKINTITRNQLKNYI